MIYNEYPDQKCIELIVSEKITTQQFDEIAPKLELFLQTHGTIKVLEIIEDFAGFEWGAFWKGVEFDLKFLGHVSHCAVVSDIGWVGPVSSFADKVLAMEIKVYPLTEVDAARAWLDQVESE